MEIHDGVISQVLYNEVREYLSREPLLFGWRATRDSPSSFWHKNYVLPGTHKHHYDINAVNSRLDFESFILTNTPLAKVAKIIQNNFFGNVAPTRVWLNAQTFGDEATFHSDFPKEFKNRAKSVVWYPVDKWERDWGGDFVVLDEQLEIEKSVLVKPNRMVVFDGTKVHSARPISRFCTELRIAISFGCEVCND